MPLWVAALLAAVGLFVLTTPDNRAATRFIGLAISTIGIYQIVFLIIR